MADGYGPFDHTNGGGGFIMGLLAGTALGMGLGMLFAPKAGSELRLQLSDQAGGLASQAQESAQRAAEHASRWVRKGKTESDQWVERGKEAVSDVTAS